ncbi:MAG TPA: cobalamin-binding protein, partial [Blastocatellia bacterium]|nr:cobalamin-binding protein [Blastocatellia bacterium]
PSVPETVFALGLDDRIVGVTTFCDYPPEAAGKERVGDTLRPSIEKIVALKPDLVIASTSSQLEQFVRKLDELGVPIYVSSPRNIEGVLDSIRRIGEITSAQQRAEALVSRLHGRIEAVNERIVSRDKPRVLFLLGSEPLITAGRPSFITDLIARAGGESISAGEESDYPQFSFETAIARQPQVIFIQSGESGLPDRLKLTPAARTGRVFHIDDALLLRPGPRIVEGLEQMAQRIHPEAFKDQLAR